jgi:hypothetical protein
MRLWVVVVVAVAVLAAAGYAAYCVWRKKRDRDEKELLTRAAMEAHHETVLLCVRCVSGDAAAVVRCVAAAFKAAHSPLRVRVAVVQEDSPSDVYRLLVDELHKQDGGASHSYVDKVRTRNTAENSSFLHAFNCWRELYREEQFVAVVDAGVQLLAGWDVRLVSVLRSVPTNVVCSAPGAGQFAAFAAGSPHQHGWPTARSRPFPYDTDWPVPGAAAHHVFAAFHGRCFASLPPVQTHVPLYVADVAWSDYLYAHGVRFATVPARVFQHFPHYSDQHLFEQRPRGWAGSKRLVLSDPFLRFADLYLDAEGMYRIGARAHAGITPSGLQTAEARTKYGTAKEARRVMQLATH